MPQKSLRRTFLPSSIRFLLVRLDFKSFFTFCWRWCGAASPSFFFTFHSRSSTFVLFLSARSRRAKRQTEFCHQRIKRGLLFSLYKHFSCTFYHSACCIIVCCSRVICVDRESSNRLRSFIESRSFLMYQGESIPWGRKISLAENGLFRSVYFFNEPSSWNEALMPRGFPTSSHSLYTSTQLRIHIFKHLNRTWSQKLGLIVIRQRPSCISFFRDLLWTLSSHT